MIIFDSGLYRNTCAAALAEKHPEKLFCIENFELNTVKFEFER